ncbi:MAG: cytidylate kinase family protein [Hyphomicrobiaceae bacterium]|nr:cytidylate kinase family protein [Hyphomicrobiaceae bacterium]
MTVIAMAREMATRGSEVAAGVAERLGLEIIHHEVVEHDIADRAHLSESEVHKFLEGEATLWQRWAIDPKRLSRYTALEILEIAADGRAVIRGWGAAALLQSIPHILTVRTCAPMDYRVQVLMKRLGIDDASIARQEIHRSDACHSGVVQRLFGVDWRDADQYAVTLNTARVSVEECVEQIVHLANSAAFQETEKSRSVLRDALILTRVNARLEQEFGNLTNQHDLSVKVAAGHITLDGATTDSDLIVRAVRALQEVEGVASVESHVKIVEFVPHHYS